MAERVALTGWRLPVLFKLAVLFLLLAPLWVPNLLSAWLGPPPEAAESPAVVEADFLRMPHERVAPDGQPSDAPLRGEIELHASHERLSEAAIRRNLQPYEPATRSIAMSSRLTGERVFVAAPGADGRLHVPNAYMLARPPYRVRQAWMPLFAVADRLRYQLDHEQHNGREEVWLTSRQAWVGARGDCEDHAILLADWLIEMGLDARVALGMHGRTGHAWVIVLHNGREYLLEATSKRKLKRWSAYPLARTLPDYHPDMMFNRETLWLNTGSQFTVEYAGDRWKPMLTFRSAG